MKASGFQKSLKSELFICINWQMNVKMDYSNK